MMKNNLLIKGKWRFFFNILHKTLGILATIGILLVLLSGALVTKTGSGEGCGESWPLCYDQLIPEVYTIETLIEYTHRLVTGVVGIWILIFSLWTGIKYRRKKEVVFVAAASIFFLILQSALGALAVVFGQSDAVLALHFGFSLLSFASVLLLCLYLFQLDKQGSLPLPTVGREIKLFGIILFVYSYVVVYLGAYVRHTASSMGCEGWPLCNGQIIPELVGPVAVQFTHRVAALILFIMYVLFYLYAKKKYQADHRIYYAAILMLGFVSLQVLTGGMVVLMEMHLVPSLLHALFISFLFGVLCYIILYLFRRKA
jgi:cytochrome c oxidase assembly protein subunit 15